MKAAFHTLGCKVNQYETEGLKEQFSAAGYEIVDEKEFADVYVINTCTVTAIADRKSRQFIRRARHINPDAVVAVTGCYAQVQPEAVSSMEEVDIVSGTNEKYSLLAHIEEFMREHRVQEPHVIKTGEIDGYEDMGVLHAMESRTRAYIKIEDGCDRFCSYCKIPYARGKVRSRSASQILEETRRLLAEGFHEIILTGINTALYGTEPGYECDADISSFAEICSSEDINKPTDLKGIEIIIALIDSLPGDFRIRLSSLEPTVIDKDQVKRLMKYEKLCHHLHLSVQSGSDAVLRAMNRHYTRQDYLEIVSVLRETDPCYGVSTDIIAGFPGETEEDHADSLDIIEKAEFCRVHAFPYSPREGTAAWSMKRVDPAAAKARNAELIAAGARSSKLFREKNIGIIRKVIFEEIVELRDADGGMRGDSVADNNTGESAGRSTGRSTDQNAYHSSDRPAVRYITGYTDNYIKVYTPWDAPDAPEGILDVKIQELFADGVKGSIIET